MHKDIKYYFINKFETNNIDMQDDKTIIVYRNYSSKKINEKLILKIKNYCKKKYSQKSFSIGNTIKVPVMESSARVVSVDNNISTTNPFKISLFIIQYVF